MTKTKRMREVPVNFGALKSSVEAQILKEQGSYPEHEDKGASSESEEAEQAQKKVPEYEIKYLDGD